MSALTAVTAVPAVTGRPHGLLEGPRFGPGGELVYSDVSGGGVWACAQDGSIREVVAKRRGIGGIVPHADGGWVVSGRTIVHVEPGGGQREIHADEGATGYNDLGVAPTGELLAGELRFHPFKGEEPRPGRLLRIGAGGAVEVLNDEVVWPNGIGVSPDGATVYISDYARRVVLAVPARGGAARVLCEMPEGSPDGLALDCDGAIWVALGEAGAVARFLPGGELDEIVSVPAGFVSSLSFGGADMRDVLMTTADSEVEPELGGTLLRARSDVAGLAMAAVVV